ncbi:OpgC domain-containing protein [Verticiella sediminum]|uniref:OpgC domain-containing protein n=1 Tax=Verticiella sediminum TaxID=1247510 RepID=A0A556A7M3_9BURK|nr:OpgC domain-containing protein [Verticiella sediminum]TSH88892.1 OpgC domain-containing protein [Verticiella sediminum]
MKNQRSLEIDVFRGLVLIFIVVDHISGSVFAWTTLRNFAIADATEVFVFLAGVVTAIAYTGILRKRSQREADRRFWRRSWEIYRAFLLLAVLMFVAGCLLMRWQLQTPSLGASEAKDFIAAPWRSLLEVVFLARQPFLADILPMYAFFALMAPLAIRLAMRSWTWLLAASIGLWLLAPWLGSYLPTTTIPHWSFNPFAWQVVFVVGLIAGLYPELAERPQGHGRRVLLGLAIAICIAGAITSLFSYHESLRSIFLSTWLENGLQTFSKPNASAVRVINFLALSWLTYLAVRRGWFDKLFVRLRLVALVGKNGLICFVGGAVISIMAEAMAYALSGGVQPAWPQGLLADVVAIAALLALGWTAEQWRQYRSGLGAPAGRLARPVPASVPAAAPQTCALPRERRH